MAPPDDTAAERTLPQLDQGAALIALYEVALPQVYGYLLRRCGAPALAEDLTSTTFLAACDTLDQRHVDAVTVAWLIGIARHKLADHWRSAAREERRLQLVDSGTDLVDDPWTTRLDAATARETLGRIDATYRAALTFRYLDDLPVRQVADLLNRGEQATEAVLVRARRAFRRAYEEVTTDE